jgi:hypothetical protein
MNGLPAGATQSGFIVKAVVALSPMLTLWAAGVIDWFLRGVRLLRSEVAPPSEQPVCDKLAEVLRPSRDPAAGTKAG